MNKNRIPRNVKMIVARQVGENSGGGFGDIWIIKKDDAGLHGLNTANGRTYQMFLSHLRIKEQFTILYTE